MYIVNPKKCVIWKNPNTKEIGIYSDEYSKNLVYCDSEDQATELLKTGCKVFTVGIKHAFNNILDTLNREYMYACYKVPNKTDLYIMHDLQEPDTIATVTKSEIINMYITDFEYKKGLLYSNETKTLNYYNSVTNTLKSL